MIVQKRSNLPSSLYHFGLRLRCLSRTLLNWSTTTCATVSRPFCSSSSSNLHVCVCVCVRVYVCVCARAVVCVCVCVCVYTCIVYVFVRRGGDWRVEWIDRRTESLIQRKAVCIKKTGYMYYGSSMNTNRRSHVCELVGHVSNNGHVSNDGGQEPGSRRP